MFPKSLTVLNSRCVHKQSCSVLATTNMFGDPCPGTHKYLEAHYQCISAAHTSTTTNRPSLPWVLTTTHQLLANGSNGEIINPTNNGSMSPALSPAIPSRTPIILVGGNDVSAIGAASTTGGSIWHGLPSSTGPPKLHTTLPGGRLKSTYNATLTKNANRHDALSPLQHNFKIGHPSSAGSIVGELSHNKTTTKTSTPPSATLTSPTPSNARILTGLGGTGSDDGPLFINKNTQNSSNQVPQSAQPPISGTIFLETAAANGNASAASVDSKFTGSIRTINNINNLNTGLGNDDSNTHLFCGPTNARNLFWNITRVGDVNVQPCPDGATGIAKWRCVLMKRISDFSLYDDLSSSYSSTTRSTYINCNTPGGKINCSQQTTLSNKANNHIRHFEPAWHPVTPDLTQCRSLWLSNLEVRVNQRDSSLISIANDLSEVTSSKTLYGGDMLVTTKIVQIMSEKMFHDKETFPDQRQREAIILELLHGVVKTGSNLLDETQLSSWLDLNQEDQMRVATSLLTGLEYNAFLLADTIIRERNVVQKVKNILLSVRVLEAKNIQTNEIFPDADQWQISDDRIELPRVALIENSEGGLVRIVFAAFDRLESILKPSYDYFDLKSAHNSVRNTAILGNNTDTPGLLQQQHIRILNSKVISASLGKGRHIQLSQPIKLVLKHLKTENVTNPTCVFWNYIDHAWSANGCNLEATNRTHSVCTCNHLTNFAILMDVMDEHIHSLFTMFDGNMRILIYISISICLVFIVIALLTLKIFNGVFIKVRNKIIRRGGHTGQRHRQSSSRRQQNNIRDQTHETIAVNAAAATIVDAFTTNAPTNNIHNLQQQFNLQHLQQMPDAAVTPSATAANFIQHNSIRNNNRNNLNANNFNMQQLQQQQQLVAAAAAAVVVANHNSHNACNNLQMNNLNLTQRRKHGRNLNQPAHMHAARAAVTLNQATTAQMNSTTSVAAVAAAATIAAALQQHASGGTSNYLNINHSRNNTDIANANANSIIMQGNIDDLQYKWWWW